MLNNRFGYSSDLPEDIREIFMWLCQDLASLQNKWSFYLELFSSEENTAILSDLARSSFQIIEETLRNDMVMAICRLSDPPQTRRMKNNLSLRYLAKRCICNSEVDKLLKDFFDSCKPIRQYKNKRLGHNDLNTTIKPHDNPLPGIGKSQIDRIVNIAGKILNIIYQNYVESELFFHPLQIGGAKDLIYWLKVAKDSKALASQF